MKRFLYFWIFSLIFFSIVSADIISINSGGDNNLIINPGSNIEGFFFDLGLISKLSDPLNVNLVSLDGSNKSNIDLSCSAFISDSSKTKVNVSVRWYKWDILNFSQNFSNNYVNGSTFSSVLGNGNLSSGNAWKCSVQFYSGSSFSDWVNSSVVEIYDPPVYVCGNGVCEPGETAASCPADCSVTPPTPPSGGGGGGGGDSPPGVVPSQKTFYLVPDFIPFKMDKGTYFKKELTIVNNGSSSFEIQNYVFGVSDFVFPESKNVLVYPGENVTLNLDIYISNRVYADVYVGYILFKSEDFEQQVRIILDVKDRGALFDIRTEVIKKYINPGGRVRAEVSMINMGELRNFDIEFIYKIVDFEGKEYTIKKEDFAINRTHTGIFYIDIPKDIPIGNYLFYTRILAPGNVTASSYDTFAVEIVSFFSWIIVILLLSLILFYVIWKLHYSKFNRPIIIFNKKREEQTKKAAVARKISRDSIEIPKLD